MQRVAAESAHGALQYAPTEGSVAIRRCVSR